MKKIFFVYFIFLLGFSALSCSKKKFDTGRNSINEDFEGIKNVKELFLDGNWKYYQQTKVNNYIKIDTINPHSGHNCLKIYAVKGIISKSDIANNKMSFWKNDIVQISAWYYLKGNDKLNFVFLCDLEENATIGASPGIRIAIDKNGYLLVERKKYEEPTIEQTTKNKVLFPRNKWVKLKIEIYLQQNNTGYIKLWQNNDQIIDAQNVQTLPKDRLYFIQGTKGMYQSIQIGVTATSSDTDIIMYIDDIKIKLLN